MHIKKTITGDYRYVDPTPIERAPTTRERYINQEWARRERAEAFKNDDRFDALNLRRIDAGLPTLDIVDHFARKHGYKSAQDHLQRVIGQRAVKPTHRDNIVLLNR